MKEKRTLLIIAVILLTCLTASAQRVIEEIVAVVNDEVITLSDYKKEYDVYIQQIKAQNLGPEEYSRSLDTVRHQLLDQMITDKLLVQEAKSTGLSVKEQLKNIVDNIKKQNNLNTDEELNKALAQQGMDYDTWIKQYELLLMRQAVIFTQIEKNIVLSDSEVIEYYKKHPDDFMVPAEYKIRAVYLSDETWHGEQLEARKQDISDKIKGGLSMEDAAAQYSDPPLKATKGDLGTLNDKEMDKDLHEAVKRIPAGGFTPWVKAKNGWYLIRVEERKESYRQTLDDAKKGIEDKMYSEARQKKLDEYLKKLRAKNYIKILNPNPIEF